MGQGERPRAGDYRGQMTLEVVVGHKVWVLGTGLGSSARDVYTLSFPTPSLKPYGCKP